MLQINLSNYNAVIGNGLNRISLRYDAEYLHGYSEMFLYGWTKEKILYELGEAYQMEIAEAFPGLAEEKVEKAALLIVAFASDNIHDPREEKK